MGQPKLSDRRKRTRLLLGLKETKMFRLFYYIFGLDGKKRWVVMSATSFNDDFLVKIQLPYHSFGWLYNTINTSDFTDVVKQDVKQLTNKYKVRVYCDVEYNPPEHTTQSLVDAMKQVALAKSELFDYYARIEYLDYKKLARH